MTVYKNATPRMRGRVFKQRHLRWVGHCFWCTGQFVWASQEQASYAVHAHIREHCIEEGEFNG